MIQLRYMKEKNIESFSFDDENIELFTEEQFDGPEFINIVLNVTGSITAISTTVAVTLTAVNKSIDEFQKITKRVFVKTETSNEVGVYEHGVKKLGKNSTNEEIDSFFVDLREGVKSEIKKNNASK